MSSRENHTSSQPEGSPAPPPALVKALTTLLRPLVRVLVSNGITYPYLASMLKGIYVDVVDKYFPLAGKEQTVSRISLVSGVHRKDVRRLLNEISGDPGPPKGVSVGARLVGIWMGAPEYLESGQPVPLPRSTPDPKGRSFDGLVESINRRDIRPRAVLDELARLGIVHVDDKDIVHLDTTAFLPNESFDELAYYFGRNLRDHIASSAHNLSDREAPFPERAVYYDRLSAESAAKLRKIADELSMSVLIEMNKHALELANADEGSPEATQRMTLGYYFYSGEDEKLVDKKAAAEDAPDPGRDED